MGFAEEVEAASVKLGAPGKLDKILEQLGEPDASELLAALADPDVNSMNIHRALKARGIKLAESTVKTWAREHR